MRIIQLIPNFGLGGIQKGGVALALGLSQLGHSVSVVGLGGGPRSEEVEKNGIKCIECEPEEVAGVVAAEDADVVHVHAPHLRADMVPALRNPAHLTVYTPVFGRPPDDPSLLNSIRLCCVGEYTAWRLWRWLGRPEAGVFSVPITPFVPPSGGQSTLDPDKVSAARARFGLPPNAFVVGRLARKDNLKWHRDSFRLISELLATNPEAYWLSVGFPDDAGAYELRRRYKGRFVNTDPISSFEDVSSLLQCMDVHLFASRFGECFSASIAESMGIGVPCIALCNPTADAGEVEQITPGVTGFLCGSIAGAVSCALRLAKDRSELEMMKLAARQHCWSKWLFSVTAKTLESAYEHWMTGADVPGVAASHSDYERLHNLRLDQAVSPSAGYVISKFAARTIYPNYRVFRAARALRAASRKLRYGSR